MKKIFMLMIGIFFIFITVCKEGKHPAVKDFEKSIEYIKQGKIENLVGNKEESKILKMFEEGYKKVEYKINNTEIKDNEVIINATIKNPDLSGIVEEIRKEATKSIKNLTGKPEKEIVEETQKIMTEAINKKIKSNDLKFKERNLNITYTKKDGKWELDPKKNVEFVKVITLEIF